MTYDLSDDARDTLRRGFKDQQLTLYLGAGVSVASALPTWDKLVLSVYFAAISERKLNEWRPFPNYLYAIAEWYLREVGEPLEVTARKLRQLYPEGEKGDEQFLFAVRDGLYRIETATLHDSGPPEVSDNATLQAVAQLCAAKAGQRYGVRSVVTYNYDDLLERCLKDRPSEDRRHTMPVYSQSAPPSESLPIFHVHGFIPFPQDGEPEPSGVVFTEEEYNAAASDPYSWSNLVQLREMSSSIGLMVGLSLADRNIRRLLDALALSPVRARIYAVLERPGKHVPNPAQVDGIDKRARELLAQFESAGIKSRAAAQNDLGYQRNPQIKSVGGYQREIRGILEAVEDLAEEQTTSVMQKLGITPIWFDHFTEIPERWSRKFGPAVKMDRLMRKTIHNDETKEPFG